MQLDGYSSGHLAVSASDDHCYCSKNVRMRVLAFLSSRRSSLEGWSYYAQS